MLQEKLIAAGDTTGRLQVEVPTTAPAAPPRRRSRATSATGILLAALAAFTLGAADTTARARYLMGTICEVATDAPDAGSRIEEALAEGARVEALLSTWSGSSELARLNRGEVSPSPELSALLAEVRRWSEATDGAFDPRIGRLVALWDTRGEGRVAAPGDVRQALESERRAPQIEEGAFGKGYALDRMLALVPGHTMINFGGQVIVRGSVPVTVADPAERRHAVAQLTLSDASISTTSGSEKTFEAGGRRFSHILDPRTGEALPPRGSVSVIAADALTADILSTALYVMGETEGLRWAGANGVAAIFINPNRELRLSAAARHRVRDLRLIDRRFTLKD